MAKEIDNTGPIRTTYSLPNEAYDDLAEFGEWHGKVMVYLTIVGAKKTKKGKHRRAIVKEPPADLIKLIKRWNRHPYIQQEKTETRNQPYRDEPNKKLVREFKSIDERLGMDRIIELMDGYLECCSKGYHVWSNQSHGFRDVSYFIAKLSSVRRDDSWWWMSKLENAGPLMEIDPNKRLTKKLADSFAITFLDEQHYPFDEAGGDYLHFMHASARLLHYMARRERSGLAKWKENDAIRYVLSCLKWMCDRDDLAVFPKLVASKTFWVTSLPQYVKEQGI